MKNNSIKRKTLSILLAIVLAFVLSVSIFALPACGAANCPAYCQEQCCLCSECDENPCECDEIARQTAMEAERNRINTMISVLYQQTTYSSLQEAVTAVDTAISTWDNNPDTINLTGINTQLLEEQRSRIATLRSCDDCGDEFPCICALLAMEAERERINGLIDELSEKLIAAVLQSAIDAIDSAIKAWNDDPTKTNLTEIDEDELESQRDRLLSLLGTATELMQAERDRINGLIDVLYRQNTASGLQAAVAVVDSAISSWNADPHNINLVGIDTDELEYQRARIASITCSTCGLIECTCPRVRNISQAASGEITITWDEFEGAVAYNIYRADTRISLYERIAGNVAGTEFTDANPNDNRFKNYYRVVPVDSNGRSFVRISWNYIDQADEYLVYIRHSSTDNFVELAAGVAQPSIRPCVEGWSTACASTCEENCSEERVRPSFSIWLEDFDINNTEFQIVPLRFGSGSDPGGNTAADNFFLEPGGTERITGWYNGGTAGNRAMGTSHTRAAPRMIDNWRNFSTAFITGYQGYNVITRLDSPILISFHTEMFGQEMIVFWPEDCQEAIQIEVNRIGDAMRTHANVAQFATERYALYFMPGEYNFIGDLARLNIGFYMTISGLGLLPTDTSLNFPTRGTTGEAARQGIFTPAALPYWNERGNANTQGRNGTHNFWRKAENFRINGMFEWSVSQAAPARRIRVDGPTNLNYRGGWVSGGYMSDMFFDGPVGAGSQQQWYTRSSHFNQSAISGGAWNIFTNSSTTRQGVSPRANDYMTGGISTWINEGMEIMREKPFLFFCTNENRYKVFVPGWRNDVEGISWGEDDPGEGEILDLEDHFFIAEPGTSSALMNYMLENGKNLLLGPGMFSVDDPLTIHHENGIILGVGMATVAPSRNNIEGAIMVSDDASGAIVASVVLDAHYVSKYLIRVGEIGANRNHALNPIFVSDVFVRVGGYKNHAIHTEVSVQINSNNVIGDHFWIWRGDHGRGIRWDRNVGTYGLVVLGDDVTMHGLFVEHYQKYQTIWRGERGRIFFYQSETPYEFLFQVYSHGGTVQGWADIKVCNDVQEFLAVCVGLYGVHNQFRMIRETAVEVPHSPGVILRHVFTNEIGGAGGGGNGITETVINGIGDSTEMAGGRTSRRLITHFENGVGTVWRTTSQAGAGRPQGATNYTAEEPPCGDLDALLIWVMQPCGEGIPAGWDPVWQMRPPGWTTARAVGPNPVSLW